VLYINRYNRRTAPLRGLSNLRDLYQFLRLRMPKFRRNFVPGGTYFFTVNLLDRKSQLLVQKIHLSGRKRTGPFMFPGNTTTTRWGEE
jgi:hypothetical protein